MRCGSTGLLLVLALAASGTGAGEAGAEWPRVCPADLFCFKHPPELRPITRQAIDSIAGGYQSEKLRLNYDLGFYSSDFLELKKPLVKPIQVDGRPAELLIAGNVMALRVPSVSGRVRFAMHLQFTGEINQALGRRIFDSIEFRVPER